MNLIPVSYLFNIFPYLCHILNEGFEMPCYRSRCGFILLSELFCPGRKVRGYFPYSGGANLPLHGMKTLVRMAISRSLGESIIRQPVIPAALQPSPIAIVRACFPQAFALLKYLSRLNAARGRYPTSSRSVNNGKKIAIGGSMTDVTQLSTRYTPSISILSAH